MRLTAKLALLIATVAISGCASTKHTEDPAIAVLETHVALEQSSKASGDTLKDLNAAIERAEKALEDAEKRK